jgi:hypothetical protein
MNDKPLVLDKEYDYGEWARLFGSLGGLRTLSETMQNSCSVYAALPNYKRSYHRNRCEVCLAACVAWRLDQ